MADSSAVSEQLAALVAAVDNYQNTTLDTVEKDRQALLEALEALGNLDSTVERKVIAMIGQPSSYFNNLTDLVKQVMAGMPDLGGMTHTLPSTVLLDTPVELSFSGITSASGQPVTYKLSNPVNCTLSAYEFGEGESVTLTPLGVGPGSVTLIAMANGVPTAPVIIEFNIISGVIEMAGFAHNVSSQYFAGQSATVSFSGALDPNDAEISYRLSNLVGISASATTVSEGGSIALTVTGAPGSTASFNVVAVANGVESDPESISFTIQAVTIDTSGLTHNVSNAYLPNTSDTVSFSGAVASDGSPVTYRFQDLVGVSLSSLTTNEHVVLTVTGSAGTTATFNVVAVSGSVESDPVAVSFQVSVVTIDMAGFTHDLASAYWSGDSETVVIGGAVASDGSDITYRIVNQLGVSFNSTELTADSSGVVRPTLTVTGAAGSTGSFGVVAVSGSVQSDPVQITFQVRAVMIDMGGFQVTHKARYKSGDSDIFSISGATASDGSAITYHLSSFSGVSLNTTTVVEGGSVTATLTGSPGSTATFVVVAASGSVQSSPVTVSLPIDAITIDMSGFSHTVASSYMNGESTTVRFTGARASDGSPITYRFSHLVGCSLSVATAGDNQGVTMSVNGSSGVIGVTAVSGAVESSVQVLTFSIISASVNTPSIQSPYNGATNVSRTPILTSSGFSTSPGGADSHSQSQWQAKNSSGTVIWDSGATTQKTSISVPELPASSLIRFVVRHYGAQLGWSAWSSEVSVQTEAGVQIGQVYSDGGIVGPVVGGYRLIIAPPSMRGTDQQWGVMSTDTPLTNITSASANDPSSGLDNTNLILSHYGSMTSQGPQAAKFCRAYGSQWFLPNKQELAEIMKYKSTIDAANNSGLTFASMGTGWIWSSSEASAAFIWACRADDGTVNYISKDNWRYVVPVRREPV